MNNFYCKAMKLIALLLLGSFLSLHAATFSQTISLSGKNLSYQKIFKEIQLQSGFRILVNRALINNDKKIVLNTEKMPLDDFLQLILTGENMGYKKDGNNIFLHKFSAEDMNDVANQKIRLGVTGKIVDSLGKPLSGAGVFALNSPNGKVIERTSSDAEGVFYLPNVQEGSVIKIIYMGYLSQELIAKKDLGTIVLKPETTGLQEVVVTGLAVSTSKYKVPFAVTKIDEKLINTVSGIDLSQTLRAKVAGITILQGEGDEPASVSLRGAKSFFGNIAPLIVVDGYVSNLNLGDLNPLDVESIEVVKGAAAAALYGTRAEGGVIQVITKKGQNAMGRLNITVDNEYGLNNVQRTPKLATLHKWKVDPNDEFGFQYLKDPQGNNTNSRVINLQPNGFSSILSPYKNFYDNVDLLMKNKPFYTNYISIATAGPKFNTYISFQNQNNSGIAEPIDANIRRTAKLNLQLKPSDKWFLETNIHYFYDSRPSVIASGGSAGTFFGTILNQEPFINLDERSADGDFVAVPRGYEKQGLNLNFNPLYEYSKRVYTNRSHEILAGGKVRYSILHNLSVEALGSINQSFTSISSLYPKGYKTALDDVTLNNGNLFISDAKSQFINGQVQINYDTKFRDFNFAASAKTVYEYYYNTYFSAQGYNFSVPLYRLENTQAASRTIAGSDDKTGRTVNYGYFLNTKLSFREKIFLDLLGRIDQSSRYGRDVESAFFPRVSLGYRMTKDVNLGKDVNELKLRASWGRAGRIPGFNAKESLATVSNTGISITQNENTNLQRSFTSELELGLDARFFRKIDLTFNYAKANSKGDFVQPPVFMPTLGTTPAFRNFGKITSSSIEFEMRANSILQRSDFNIDLGLTFARTRSKIKELGDGLPNFSSGIYRKEPGLSPYAFFGQQLLTDLSELNVVDGVVTNAAGGNRPLSDFAVNAMGQVVVKSTIGTADERPLYLQENGVAKNVVIGDAQPDFIAGFNTTLTFFKNFQLYVTLDWNQGGSKYNQTSQYLTRGDRSELWQDYTLAGYPQAYIQGLYNGNSVSSFWIENSSYLSLREVSLSYTMPRFKALSVLQNARIAVTGRNLVTFTKFSGSNTEDYYEDFPYPVYRTFTAKLTLNF